jgi:hypothetical protein
MKYLLRINIINIFLAVAYLALGFWISFHHARLSEWESVLVRPLFFLSFYVASVLPLRKNFQGTAYVLAFLSALGWIIFTMIVSAVIILILFGRSGVG